MRNHTDVMSKNSTASFRLKEGESALMVLDSRMEGSSIERHRKRIFEGRSKSVRTRRNNLQATASRGQITKPESQNSTVMQKVEEMQQQINRLTDILQQKQRRQAEEQRKINDIINIKNKQVRNYLERIEQLTGDLESKNRELQSYKLEIQRLQRCNRIQHETEQLSELVDQENGKSINSFFEPNSRNEWKSRHMSLTASPENSAGRKVLEGINESRKVATEDFLSPFSVTRMVEAPDNRHKLPSPLKDTHPNLLSFTVPSGGFQQYQQVVVRPAASPTPVRGAIINPYS